MNGRTLKREPRLPLAVSWTIVAAATACLAATTSPASALGAPTPAEYGVGELCPAPVPGHSGCLGLRLFAFRPLVHRGARTVPADAPAASSRRASAAPLAESIPPASAVERTTPIEGSLVPADVVGAYGLRGGAVASTQTIALVDAYDDATIASDLEVFSSRFGLPACNEANGCFRKVNQRGAGAPLPPSSGVEERGWAQEIATDVELAHGVCPACRILLVEAESNANASLYAAEQTAVSLGANEISNSWGGEEPSVDSPAFDHPGVVIAASAGDDGYLDWLGGEPARAAEYPASSPHVVAVGGTRLTLNATTRAWQAETVWNDGGYRNGVAEGLGAGGGGCSASFAAAPWQQSVANWSAVGCESRRAVADVSADADPYTGVAVYDSTEYEGARGWTMIGGTSVAAPIVASAFALAGGGHGVAYPAQTLYENERVDATALHDVSGGSNGECRRRTSAETGEARCSSEEEARSCSGQAICLALTGFDGPSGVGTPAGLDALLPPSEHRQDAATPGAEASGASPVASGGGGAGATTTTTTTEAATDTGAAAPVPPAPGAGGPAPGAPLAAGATSPTPLISALRLTRAARAAATRRRLALSRVAFAFDARRPAHVRATLARLVRVRGRARWRRVSTSLAFLARAGSQSRRLSGGGTLASGRYRLTLTPVDGATRSLTFTVG
jgi:hypothetical protein